ncbi:MAG: PulJ/GspJ family protein [Luteolibacter sp.]
MKKPIRNRAGFTLLELLVAMAITTIIVTVLVSITSIAIDVWNRSRSELRASRQAKAMVDTLARDIESLVSRSGNNLEWLNAKTEAPKNSSNAAKMIFFTAAGDRYNGEINTAEDKGGDVSCVGYQLDWKDPIDSSTGEKYETFVLYRQLVNPDEAFEKLLGQENLAQAFQNVSGDIQDNANFICENVFQFTMTFHLEIPAENAGDPPTQEQVVIQPSGGVSEFSITGNGIRTNTGATGLDGAKLRAVSLSLTVLSDSAVDALRKRGALGNNPEWLAKNSFQYSKRIPMPGG